MDRERSVEALGQLFEFYLDHVEAMPKSYAELANREPAIASCAITSPG